MITESRFEEMWKDYLANKLPADDFLVFIQCVKSGQFDQTIKQQIDDLLLSDDITIELPPARAQDIMINIQLSEKQTSRLITLHKPFQRKFYWLGAACITGLLAIFCWLVLRNRPSVEIPMVKAVARQGDSVSKLATNRFIRLSDGSFVILKGNSDLDYPDHFTGSTREVTLRGEAYFDVRHSSSQTFVVHAGGITTVVLGTAFEIMALPGQNKVTVTVTRGKVRVGSGRKTFAIIVPNQQVSINTGSHEATQTQVNADSVTAWERLGLVFSDLAFEDAARLIENKYHVRITIPNEALKKCRISASFVNQENLEEVLTVVCATINARFELQPDDQIIIHDLTDK